MELILYRGEDKAELLQYAVFTAVRARVARSL